MDIEEYARHIKILDKEEQIKQYGKLGQHIIQELAMMIDIPKPRNEVLLGIAEKLNLDTEGKTEKQLGEEILTKVINNDKIAE